MSARSRTAALLASGVTLVGGATGVAQAQAPPASPPAQNAPAPSHGKAPAGAQDQLNRVAQRLDVTPPQLREALAAAQQKVGGQAMEQAKGALAKALDVTPEQLDAALKEIGVMPGAKQGRAKSDHAAKGARKGGENGRHGKNHRAGGQFAAKLAKALDKDPGEVRRALQQVSKDQRGQAGELRKAFVAAVAEKLGKPADQVEAAFAAEQGHR